MINFRLQRLEYFDSLGSPFGDEGFEVMVGDAKALRFARAMGWLTTTGGHTKVVRTKSSNEHRLGPEHCVLPFCMHISAISCLNPVSEEVSLSKRKLAIIF